ncbi:hypothetical protein GUJ93_ZPchr0013g35007 [Zizania palustris]|uniref:Uncharacterized protein n=1 Tax=Zizania palustris TaxID=103762 RepID=A0A8J5WYL6_ZIZPA|nr:hypothetical protein GUJ93_ZPchr0013g35007 [Zizania palustris]
MSSTGFKAEVSAKFAVLDDEADPCALWGFSEVFSSKCALPKPQRSHTSGQLKSTSNIRRRSLNFEQSGSEAPAKLPSEACLSEVTMKLAFGDCCNRVTQKLTFEAFFCKPTRHFALL